MSEKSEPGKLETVDIKTVWPKEENFSDWLTKNNGLKLLGDAIDMDLNPDSPSREVQVGLFSADLVCSDLADGKWVVIENQFKKSDHDHLGKLLTYASGLEDIKAVVWIAEEIGDEHRATLKWLNERTNDRTGFFGFEIEVVKIGKSDPAPQLRKVAWPDEWVRDAVATDQESETKRFCRKYWTSLKEYMKVNGHVKMRKPLLQNWATFPVGKSFSHIEASISVTKNRGRVFLHISKKGKDGHRIMDYVRDQHGENFSKNLGGDIEYNYIKGKRRTAQVSLMKENVNANNVNEWNEQHKWFSETIDKFDKVFRPIVADINLDDFPYVSGGPVEENGDGEHDSP